AISVGVADGVALGVGLGVGAAGVSVAVVVAPVTPVVGVALTAGVVVTVGDALAVAVGAGFDAGQRGSSSRTRPKRPSSSSTSGSADRTIAVAAQPNERATQVATADASPSGVTPMCSQLSITACEWKPTPSAPRRVSDARGPQKRSTLRASFAAALFGPLASAARRVWQRAATVAHFASGKPL